MRTTTLLAGFTLMMLFAGCGQKGALTLPEHRPASTGAAQTPATAAQPPTAAAQPLAATAPDARPADENSPNEKSKDDKPADEPAKPQPR